MNVKKIDPKLYKAIMMAFQYQINCELTPEQCKELVDFIDNPLVIDDEEVCEWVMRSNGIAENPHNNIITLSADGIERATFCPTCGRRIKYVEVE